MQQGPALPDDIHSDSHSLLPKDTFHFILAIKLFSSDKWKYHMILYLLQVLPEITHKQNCKLNPPKTPLRCPSKRESLLSRVSMHPSLHNAKFLGRLWGKKKQRKQGKDWLLRWKPEHVKSDMTYLWICHFWICLHTLGEIFSWCYFMMNIITETLEMKQIFKGLSDSLKPIW